MLFCSSWRGFWPRAGFNRSAKNWANMSIVMLMTATKPNSITAASTRNSDYRWYFTCPIWTTGEPKLWRTSHYSTTRSCCSRLAFNESSLTDIFQPKEYSNELPQCCVKPAPIAFCICGLCWVLTGVSWVPFDFRRLRQAESTRAWHSAMHVCANM